MWPAQASLFKKLAPIFWRHVRHINDVVANAIYWEKIQTTVAIYWADTELLTETTCNDNCLRNNWLLRPKVFIFRILLICRICTWMHMIISYKQYYNIWIAKQIKIKKHDVSEVRRRGAIPGIFGKILISSFISIYQGIKIVRHLENVFLHSLFILSVW